MDDAVRIDIGDSIADADRNMGCAFLGKLTFCKNLSQRNSIDPLHDKVVPAMVLTPQHPHDLRVI